MIGGQAKIFDHAGHKEATEEDTESRSHIEMVPDYHLIKNHASDFKLLRSNTW